MPVKTRQVAFLGLLAAIVSILIVFASILETNTLFLLAAAAYLVGIAIREYGLRLGVGFFLACILLGFLLSPNKLYVFTYAGLSFYILGNEASYLLLTKKQVKVNKRVHFWIKLVLFNIIYLPAIILFPKLLFVGIISTPILIGLLAGGQVGWLIYDKAYDYFQSTIWGKFRSRVGFSNE